MKNILDKLKEEKNTQQNFNAAKQQKGEMKCKEKIIFLILGYIVFD